MASRERPPLNVLLLIAAIVRDPRIRMFAATLFASVIGAVFAHLFVAERGAFAVCVSMGFLSVLGVVLAAAAAAGRLLGSPVCRSCGYDLRGAYATQLCPECGSDAGMMRRTIATIPERRIERRIRCTWLCAPAAFLLSFWPFALPLIEEAGAMGDLPGPRLLVGTLIAAWCVILGIAAFGLLNIERRRRFDADCFPQPSDAHRPD